MWASYRIKYKGSIWSRCFDPGWSSRSPRWSEVTRFFVPCFLTCRRGNSRLLVNLFRTRAGKNATYRRLIFNYWKYFEITIWLDSKCSKSKELIGWKWQKVVYDTDVAAIDSSANMLFSHWGFFFSSCFSGWDEAFYMVTWLAKIAAEKNRSNYILIFIF